MRSKSLRKCNWTVKRMVSAEISPGNNITEFLLDENFDQLLLLNSDLHLIRRFSAQPLFKAYLILTSVNKDVRARVSGGLAGMATSSQQQLQFPLRAASIGAPVRS